MQQILKIIVVDQTKSGLEVLARAFQAQDRKDVILHLESLREIPAALIATDTDLVIFSSWNSDQDLLNSISALRGRRPELGLILRLAQPDLGLAAAASKAGADAVFGQSEPDNLRLVSELDLAIRRRRELGSATLRELAFIRFSLDRFADAALWMKEDGSLCYVNDAASRSLGYEKQELLGLTIFDIAPRLTQSIWKNHWERLVRQESFSLEYDYRRSNGEFYPVELSVNYVVFEGVAYNCTFARDISRRRRLEERLRQAEKLEAIGQLAGGVAHDFNNLLTVIMGQTELMLMEEDLDSSLRLSLNEVALASKHAATLTNQLLAFGRRQPRRARLIEPARVVQELQPALGRLINSPCQLLVEIAADLPKLLADPGQLEQIILNLALNARDAMPAGGIVQLRVGRKAIRDADARRYEVAEGGYVELRVTDEGEGIDDETKRRIFEPFFTTKELGTGLGLSTVYGIVKQSGGSIRVEAGPKGGSSFVVLLPAQADCEVKADQRASLDAQ